MAFVSEHVLDCCSFAPPSRSMRALRVGAIAALASLSLAACKKPAPPAQKPAVDVTAVTVTAQSTPVDFEFTAQTQSSREVEIRARVDGFLEKRMYTEGALVSANQVMFLMDKRPFEAALQTAKGSLAQQQARLLVTQQNLARVKPLAAMNALSKKDLDDAIGNEKSAEAAVIAAKGEVQTAELNLSYTTIRSPLKGLSSFARIQEGSYVTPTQGGLLTYVYQLDPMWVNFSISENELLGYREQIKKGELRFPPDNKFDVTVIQADGSVFPQTGRIDFTNPAFSTETGTFLVRAVFANPQGTLRPGQFVKARVAGAVRQRDSRAATRRAAGREESLRVGARRTVEAASARRRSRRMARRRLVHHERPEGGRTRHRRWRDTRRRGYAGSRRRRTGRGRRGGIGRAGGVARRREERKRRDRKVK